MLCGDVGAPLEPHCVVLVLVHPMGQYKRAFLPLKKKTETWFQETSLELIVSFGTKIESCKFLIRWEDFEGRCIVCFLENDMENLVVWSAVKHFQSSFFRFRSMPGDLTQPAVFKWLIKVKCVLVHRWSRLYGNGIDVIIVMTPGLQSCCPHTPSPNAKMSPVSPRQWWKRLHKIFWVHQITLNRQKSAPCEDVQHLMQDPKIETWEFFTVEVEVDGTCY